MASVGYATLDIIPSLKGMEKNLEQGMVGPSTRVSAKSGKKSGEIFARSYLGPLKAVGGAALGFLAIDKISGVIKDSIGEARESQKVTALTAQVIKSTGGAAHVTAKQVSELSTALSNKTGIDDETIQAGQNMLLTFKNVRNEVGKGNKIFDQASSILVDLSSAMGTEPKQAAIQLGKALNDPIKGITALTRVGVTFDDQQKKTIKHLVNTGHAMDAQKIILKELNSEFGGAAAAQATAGDKAKVAFKNLEEQIGTALLPTVDRLENKLSKKIIPDVSRFIHEMQTGKGTGGAVARDLKEIYDAGVKVVHIGGAVVRAFDGLPNGLKKAIAVGGISAFALSKIPGVRPLGKVATGALGGSLTSGVQKVFVVNEGFGKGGVGGAAGGAGAAAEGAAAGTLLSKVGRFAVGAGKIYAAAGALTAVQEALNGLGGHHRSGLLAPFTTPKSGPSTTFGPGHTLKHDAQDALNATKFGGTFSKLDRVLSAPFGGDTLSKSVANIKQLDTSLAKLSYKNPTQGQAAFNKVLRESGLTTDQLNKILPKTARRFADLAPGRTQATLRRMVGDLTGTSRALTRSGLSVGTFTKKLRTLPKQVQTKVLTPGAIKSRADITALDKKYHLTKRQVQTLVQLLGVQKANAGLNSVRGNADRLDGKHARVNVSVDGVATSIRQVDALNFKLGNIHNQSATITTYYRSLGKKHATGGPIFGPGTGTSDSIPAMLSNGEFVVNARAASRYRRQLEAMNAHRFANGGSVGGSGAAATWPRSMTLVIGDNEFDVMLEESIDDHLALNP